MKHRNLTVRGKTDGFGCQYNAILSGMAFCEKHTNYNYIHTPFSSVSHGYTSKEDTAKLNKFIGIPDGRKGQTVYTAYKYLDKVFKNPCFYYDQIFRDIARRYYWQDKEPVDTDIVVHIRRGDMDQGYRRRFKKATRYQSNGFYNELIPSIVAQYPDDYAIIIHSEGEFSEFADIQRGWSRDISERVVWKLGKSFTSGCEFNLMTAFHDMVCAKVLVQSKSGLSYTAGLLNENNVHYMRGNKSTGQKIPLEGWILI